ncbi:MAG TPA: hypothetical protein VGJ18_03375 [Gemmatimonadaceae bacterium]
MPLPSDDPFIDAIAQRIRAVTARLPRAWLDILAEMLRVPAGDFRVFIEEPGRRIDTTFLIEVVAALVQEYAVDPQWLLSGEYDYGTHRDALLLGEDRSPRGGRVLREFVGDLFRRLRDRPRDLTSLPPSNE